MGIFSRKPNIEKLQASKNVKGLIKTLKDEDSEVRWKAADALGEIGDSRAVEPLTEALKDEDSEFSVVREATEEALKKIKANKN